MWRRTEFYAVAAAIALAGMVIASYVERGLGDLSRHIGMLPLLLAIALFGVVVFVKERRRVQRRRDDALLPPAGDSGGVRRRIEPHRKVVYQPALGPPAVVAALSSAGWVVCWSLTLSATDGRWSAERCGLYYCGDEAGLLAALLLFGMVIGSVVAFRVSGHRWRVRLQQARPYDPYPMLDPWVLGAMVASGFLIPGIWSAIVGATHYANDPPIAVGFVLTAIGAPVALAALSRAGYVSTLRTGSTMLTTQRHYPSPPASSTLTAAVRILEAASRRVFFRPRGKAVPGFDTDSWFDVVDKVALIPSVRTFMLASRVTVVVAGRLVAVFACTQWPSGRYARHGEVSVKRDGQRYHDSHGILAKTITAFDWLSHNVPAHPIIRAFIVVTTEAGGAVTFDNDTDAFQLIHAADAPEAIASFLKQQSDVVDRRVALAVWLAGPHLTGTGY